MIEFFTEYGSTILVAGALVAIVAAIVVKMVRRVRAGRCVGECKCCNSKDCTKG
ncbi:MAG: FeoB-associated Cys-rich membrane protein [Clostridiales Family XIII bacterium]|nr:FeoB-associated Cys-rich membrane protein [Clostridiales Family XIII bacterium]